MSKGGTTTSTSSIDPQIKEAFLANFQQAQGVAGALPTQQIAGFNPMYQAGEEALVNTGLAGPGITGTDLAAQMAAYGGVYQPNQLTAQQTNLGMTGPGSIASYMNPYTEAVRKNALADLESSRQAAIQQTGERATAARAFGGSRQGVAEALTNQGFAKQAATLGTTLNEQAFNQAMAMQQADIARRSAADTVARLGIGAAGRVLKVNSGATAPEWAVDPTTDVVTTAGDLIYGTAADTVARLGIGTAGQVLKVNSGATAPEWGAAAGGSFVGCVVYNSANQSLANSTEVKITFNSESLDTDSFHSTSSNTSRITIPAGKGGKYLFFAFGVFVNNANGYRQLQMWKNNDSTTRFANFTTVGNSTSTTYGNLVGVIDLVATDYVELIAYQNSGGSLDFYGGAMDARFGCIYLGA